MGSAQLRCPDVEEEERIRVSNWRIRVSRATYDIVYRMSEIVGGEPMCELSKDWTLVNLRLLHLSKLRSHPEHVTFGTMQARFLICGPTADLRRWRLRHLRPMRVNLCVGA